MVNFSDNLQNLYSHLVAIIKDKGIDALKEAMQKFSGYDGGVCGHFDLEKCNKAEGRYADAFIKLSGSLFGVEMKKSKRLSWIFDFIRYSEVYLNKKDKYTIENPEKRQRLLQNGQIKDTVTMLIKTSKYGDIEAVYLIDTSNFISCVNLDDEVANGFINSHKYAKKFKRSLNCQMTVPLSDFSDFCKKIIVKDIQNQESQESPKQRKRKNPKLKQLDIKSGNEETEPIEIKSSQPKSEMGFCPSGQLKLLSERQKSLSPEHKSNIKEISRPKRSASVPRHEKKSPEWQNEYYL